MSKYLLCIAALTSTLTGAWGTCDGAEFGTPQEAKAMLDRALAEMRANKIAAIDKFNFNEKPFRDRDLFVFCFGVDDGKFTAHEAMISFDVRTLRDKTGKAFGEELYRKATEVGVAEVVFWSPYPGSTKQVEMRSYAARIGDQVCGVSAYQNRDVGDSTQ